MSEQTTNTIRRHLETILTVLIILKLLHLIDWSWWWVLSLVWVPAALAIVVYVAGWMIAISILFWNVKVKPSTRKVNGNG